MSKIMQLFYFVCYAVTAAVAIVLLPRIVPTLDPSFAWIAGAMIFLAGALVHEIAVRRRNETRTQHRLILLHRAQNELREEVARIAEGAVQARARTPAAEAPGPAWTEDPSARREPTLAQAADPPTQRLVADQAQRVRVSLPEQRTGNAASTESPNAPVGPDGPVQSQSDELAAEVRVLHSLVQRLYLPKGAEAGSAASSEPDINDPGGTSVDPSDRVLIDRVRDAMRHNQVQLYIQPIVALPQRKRRFSHCSIYLHPGEGGTMGPERYLAAGRRSGLETELDNMLLFRTIQMLRKAQQQNYSTAYFCAISSRSLNDRKFFPDFLSYLGKCTDLAPNVVFDIAQQDLVTPTQEVAADLQTLVSSGFRLCLTDVDDIDLDVPTLSEHGVRFVRLDAGILMPAAKFDMEANRVRVLKQALDRAGVDLIVANIENESMLVELLDFNIDLGQGTLFGEPRSLEEANVAFDPSRPPSRVNEA
jgi:cyclic-di-GMP phosphodiesterase TipF (flagellum assembly factor)